MLAPKDTLDVHFLVFSINKKNPILKIYNLFIVIAFIILTSVNSAIAVNQTITLQTGALDATFTNGTAGWFNSGSELGFYAKETGSKQAAAWMDFTTTGNGTSGSNRSLQIGDTFSITPRITRAFGQVGFSLNDNGSQGSNYDNRISGSRLYINTDNNGSWFVGGLSGGATSSFSYNPSQDTYRDYKFEVKITSATTVDIDFYVNGVFQSRAYNLTMAGSAGANIDAFSMYGSDMWDGNSNDDGFFKNGYIDNTGSVNLGYYLTSGTFDPGQITDGLAANSTTTSSVNAVNIGGDSGTAVLMNQDNSGGPHP
jgi:hypothetical protein